MNAGRGRNKDEVCIIGLVVSSSIPPRIQPRQVLHYPTHHASQSLIELLCCCTNLSRWFEQGYINAWDRLPYITTIRNGSASTEPAINRISQNFFLGTYSPLLDVDTDDGASFYETSAFNSMYQSASLIFFRVI